MRGATFFKVFSSGLLQISTHTPLAGRDGSVLDNLPVESYFYSHAPCGARQKPDTRGRLQNTFLLTRPLRGATDFRTGFCSGGYISTHTPLAGRDRIPWSCSHTLPAFLLTRPLRGATIITELNSIRMAFLLTRPLRGATKIWTRRLFQR